MSTTPVFARVDSDLKKEAEDILDKLGISPTSAISMFYKQLVLKNGMPFDLTLNDNKPLDITFMSEAQIDREIMKGIDDMENGRVESFDDFDKRFKKEHNL